MGETLGGGWVWPGDRFKDRFSGLRAQITGEVSIWALRAVLHEVQREAPKYYLCAICALNPLNLCQNRPLPTRTVPARVSPRQECVAMADGVTHGTPPGVFAMRHPAIAAPSPTRTRCCSRHRRMRASSRRCSRPSAHNRPRPALPSGRHSGVASSPQTNNNPDPTPRDNTHPQRAFADIGSNPIAAPQCKS